MAGEDGHQALDLTAPAGFDPAAAEAFQAVRRLARARAEGGPPVGADVRPDAEPVRFHAADGMRFPETELAAPPDPASGPADRTDLTVAFMGLTGPSGVLPDHYSELVVERRRARDPGLALFLDLFNHRAVSHFYRAWAKYRLPVAYEEARGSLDDGFSRTLAALAGLGLTALKPRPDQAALLGLAGPLSRRVRSADGLRRILSALFDLPVRVEELQGRWIDIGEDDRTRLGSAEHPEGSFARLGVDAVAGASTYDVQGRIRLRFGPMGLDRFRSFFAADGPRREVSDAVRMTVGSAVDFDLRLVLRREEAPPLRLGDPDSPALLGRTTWLLHGPAERDLDDAVLPASG